MRKYQPALLGGLFIGVLSSLPIVSSLNYCCCLWVIGGGVLVTYLQQQATPTPVATGDAAISGLIAGALGARHLCRIVTCLLHAAAGGPIALEQIREQSHRCRRRRLSVRRAALFMRLRHSRSSLMCFVICVPTLSGPVHAGLVPWPGDLPEEDAAAAASLRAMSAPEIDNLLNEERVFAPSAAWRERARRE